jgi:hypothetical protein
MNLQMKRVESKSKVNFYSCETALEEIRIGLQELTIKKLQLVYEEALVKYTQDYATLSDSELNNQLKLNVRIKLETELSNDLNTIRDKFIEFLSTYPAGTFKVSLGGVVYNDDKITFLDTKIEYLNNDYLTTITSDLVILIPKFTADATGTPSELHMEQYYQGYSLVADGGIYSLNSDGTTTITGNVYAGEDGITVKDTTPDANALNQHQISFSSNDIVTRGDITVIDSASLTVGDMTQSATSSIVWADNIKTQTTINYLPGSPLHTKLTMNAINILEDDLSVDGIKSEVKLKGALIGYTKTNKAKAELQGKAIGSSITVNGSGSSLNLKELSALVLAGRAYVTIEEDSVSYTSMILTGESLALKSNQKAYLLPGAFLSNIMHNPVTQKDIAPSGNVIVQITGNNYTDYIDSVVPYKTVAKQIIDGTGSASTLWYYYMNFANGIKADAYMHQFMQTKASELVMNDTFILSEVSKPDIGRVESVGNLMFYNPEEAEPLKHVPGKSSLYNITEQDSKVDEYIANLKFDELNDSLNYNVFSSTYLKGKQVSMLSGLYSQMSHLLIKGSYSPEDQVVDATVSLGGIIQVTNENIAGYALNSPDFQYYQSIGNYTWDKDNTHQTDKSILVVKGDVTIADNSYFNGLLIATGNVAIGQNVSINGLIIAAKESSSTGNVTIGDNSSIRGRVVAGNNIMLGKNSIINCNTTLTFDTSLTVDQFLSDLFDKDAKLLMKLFKNPNAIPISINNSQGDLIEVDRLSNLVIYENWRKDQ